jgi:hypothetical protein
MDPLNKKKTGWKQKLLHELTAYWLIVIYLSFFFGVFTNYRRLILAKYEISYTAYGFSVIKALVLSKVILVAESLHLGRGNRDRPLIVPTLYKAFLFTVCMGLFDVIESMIRSFIRGRGLMEAIAELISRFGYEWFAGALVIFSAFIPFFAARELGQVLGEGTISKLFFQRRSTTKPGSDRAQNTPGT